MEPSGTAEDTMKKLVPMKPETILRRASERRNESASRRAYLIQRLRDSAERDGADSIWVEMLAELVQS
jgi:hypothetical protein